MSRVQLALRVSDLEASIAFYASLFGVQPAKRRPGYANFAVAEPPLKLVLIEGEADQPTVLDHLGVEVGTTGEVTQATERLSDLGLFTAVENDTTCCYALQDKVWVHGPGSEPWEVYTVKADAPDATSIRPADRPDSGPCTCGTPAGTDGEPPSSCCPHPTWSPTPRHARVYVPVSSAATGAKSSTNASLTAR